MSKLIMLVILLTSIIFANEIDRKGLLPSPTDYIITSSSSSSSSSDLAEENRLYNLIENLANRVIPINGYFAHYDNNDPYGWIYMTVNGRVLAKLEGMDENGYLIWTRLDPYFDNFYFENGKIYIGSPADFGLISGPTSSSSSSGITKVVTGTVINATTGQPIKDARVVVLVDEDGNVVATGMSDSNGHFSLNIPNYDPNKVYTIQVEKDGYRVSLGKITPDLVGNSDRVNFGLIELVDQQNAILSTIEGRVFNSVTGENLNVSATVKLYKGSYQTDGTPIKETFTMPDGTFKLENIEPGNYTLVVSAEGYIPNYTNITVDEPEEYIEISLSPDLVTANGQELRIQLSWGKDPSDLDSHLLFLKNNELKYHIYWAEKYAYFDTVYNRYVVTDYVLSDERYKPIAFLDRDDITSYGPETTTIYNVDANGIYKYFVHNYSDRYDLNGNMALAYSGAKVKVFTNDGIQRVFNVPNEPGVVWKVFEIRNGQIIPCEQNCMFNIYPKDDVLSTRAIKDKMINNLLRYMKDKK